MLKVKVFRAATAEELEYAVERWLSDHPHAVIQSAAQCSDAAYITLTVFYTEGEPACSPMLADEGLAGVRAVSYRTNARSTLAGALGC